jgi:hypothetical protein
MTITLIIGIRQGELLNTENLVKIKKHGYPAIAIFKRGVEYLGKLIFNNNRPHIAVIKALQSIIKSPTFNNGTCLNTGGVL